MDLFFGANFRRPHHNKYKVNITKLYLNNRIENFKCFIK